MLDDAMGLFRLGFQLLLIVGYDFESVQDAGECGLGSNADQGVLVEQLVHPWDLGNGGKVKQSLCGIPNPEMFCVNSL